LRAAYAHRTIEGLPGDLAAQRITMHKRFFTD